MLHWSLKSPDGKWPIKYPHMYNKSILPIQKLEQYFILAKNIFNSGKASPNLSPQNAVEYLGNMFLALRDKM